MTRASRGTGRVQQACLNVASIIGAVAILWFLLSLLLGWSLVLFKTGSMAPTYPTGAAAVAIPVAADAIEPGDVVTVPRSAGGLPVTHRVVSVTDPATGDGVRELVLKGDDNATPDLEVYRVAEADKVVVGVPYLGYAVTLLAQPKTLAILTTVLAALTVWVFWPRGEDDEEADAEGGREAGGEGHDHAGETAAGAGRGERGAPTPTPVHAPAVGVTSSALHRGTEHGVLDGRGPALAGAGRDVGPRSGAGPGDHPVLTRAMLREGQRPPPTTQESST